MDIAKTAMSTIYTLKEDGVKFHNFLEASMLGPRKEAGNRQDGYISYINCMEGYTGNRRVAIFCVISSDL